MTLRSEKKNPVPPPPNVPLVANTTCVPAAPGFANVNVTVRVSLTASVPKFCGNGVPGMPPKVTSVKVTFVAGAVPLFCTVIVKVTVPPGLRVNTSFSVSMRGVPPPPPQVVLQTRFEPLTVMVSMRQPPLALETPSSYPERHLN